MKLAKTWGLIAVIAAAPLALADVGAEQKRPPTDPKLTFEKYKLPNGLDVILAPDKTVPLVAIHRSITSARATNRAGSGGTPLSRPCSPTRSG